MKYRAIRCEKCGNVEPMSLDAKTHCKCGGENFYGWQVIEREYSCFKVTKSVKELFSNKLI